MPVMISRSGRCPWRTRRRRPASVLRSACRCRKSPTSASTACVSRARAPLPQISVSESVKVPGCASLKTLVSTMAYHSFGGEVEALNTPTIRRLTPSCRHQLSRIARDIPLILWRGAGKWYGRGQRPSTVYRRSRVTAARKLRFVEQPRLHAGQPDRRLAFNIDAHEQAYADLPRGFVGRAV